MMSMVSVAVMSESDPAPVETWLIISWCEKYGRMLDTVIGTHEQARKAAMQYIPAFSPIGIVKEVV
jgi:hypothetical protein